MATEQLYTSYKPLLFSLAYRMLGSVMDAEDIVQEVFLSLKESELGHVHNIRSYLCKIVTNRSIDRLHSASKTREVYVGTWLPEPLVTDESESIDPVQSYLVKESISTAYLLLLQQLSWVERAVFLLREVMQYEYDEIADIVGKSSTNCRQIFGRARRGLGIHPASDTAGQNLQPSVHAPTSHLVEQFMHALATGNIGQLMNVLSSDATLYTDGGGKVTAPARPIQGANRVSRFLAGLPAKVPGMSSKLAIVNGQPGIVMYVNGQTLAVISFQVKDERIAEVYSVANPEKLRHVR